MTNSQYAARRPRVLETMSPTQTGRYSELPSQGASSPPVEGAFEAVLFPNRSLPNKGFVVLMTVVVAVNVLLGISFTLVGAWPVLAFGGLDILLVWLAFRLSYRQGRLHERVRVTPDQMIVSRILPSGHEMRWVLQPYWTRVTIDRPVRHESQLCVHSKGGVLILGSFLSPKERAAFADRLSTALHDTHAR